MGYQAITPNQQVNHATDADFRAFCQLIHDSITNAGTGLVNTGDTGQIDLATVPRPNASNQSRGYKIYRFNDALQATRPVFLKVEFGSGTAAAGFAVWITIGTGSDGAGNLTGTVGARKQLGASNFTASGTVTVYFSGGDANRFVYLFGPNSGVTNGEHWIFGFSIERTRNKATGAVTGDGVLFAGWAADGAKYHEYVPFGQTPFNEANNNMMALIGATTGVYGADVYNAPDYWNSVDGSQYPTWRSLNYLGCFTADYSMESNHTINTMGGDRTFKMVPFRSSYAPCQFGNSSLLVLWE